MRWSLIDMSSHGKLYVVATPIGNLEDMAPRAVQALQSAHCIAAEDTRHSAKLLKHFAIRTTVIAYHEHNEAAQAQRILGSLEAGRDVALISDAGTPLVSDPGYRLVRAAHQGGYAVVPVPGPSALCAALSAAGLPTDRFFFEGFLVARALGRRQRLRELCERRETLVFFEAAHRIADCLRDMVDIFGAGREAAYCRELTKAFETVRLLSLGELAAWVAADEHQQRGEIVVVVAGAADVAAELDDATRSWLVALAEELPPARAAAIGAKATGLKKRQLYDWLQSRGDGGA